MEITVKFYTEVMGFYVIMEPTLVKEENKTAIGQMCIDIFGKGWGTFKIGFELFEFKESKESKPCVAFIDSYDSS